MFNSFGNQQCVRFVKTIWETPTRDCFLFAGYVIQCSSCQDHRITRSRIYIEFVGQAANIFLDKRSLHKLYLYMSGMFYLVLYTYTAYEKLSSAKKIRHSSSVKSKPCFKIFTRGQVVNKMIVMKPSRNLLETRSGQNLILLRNFQYWPKFLVSYKEGNV